MWDMKIIGKTWLKFPAKQSVNYMIPLTQVVFDGFGGSCAYKFQFKFSEWSFVYIMELGCDTWLIKSWIWTLETIAAPEQLGGWHSSRWPLKILSKQWSYT